MSAGSNINVNCIICDGSDWIPIYSKLNKFIVLGNDFKFDQQLILCWNCGCTRVIFNDDFGDDNLSRYYTVSLRTPVSLESVSENRNDPRVLNAIKRTDFIEQHSDGKRLLEIGFGDGFTLLESQKRGYDCTGIDPTSDYDENISYLKKEGVEILNEDFKNFSTVQKYEIVSAFLLMEHIKDPSGFLKKVNTLLEDNGFLIVEVPDVMNYKNFYSESQMTFEHIYHYTIDTLELLMNKEGFELAHYSSPGAGYPFALTASFKKVGDPKRKINRPDLSGMIREAFNLYFSKMNVYKREISLEIESIIERHGNIVVFGAGKFFDSILEIVGKDKIRSIDYFVDETTDKIGTFHHGKKIKSISSLAEDRPSAVLIASEIFALQIKERIEKLSPNTVYYCIQNDVLNNLKSTIS